MALIPMFQIYSTLGIFDTDPQPCPLPHGLRTPVRDLPVELLHRHTKGRHGGGADRRRVRDPHLPAVDPSAGVTSDRLARDLQFLWTWNDLIVALTFGRETQPITVAIFTRLRQFGSNVDLIAPATFISLAIPLVVFFAFQRFFVQGLLAGSVK